MTDVAALSATELAALYAASDLSPVEAARDALDRIARFEPAVNAFAHLDPAATLAAASASEARWRAGAALCPLDGVPVTIKDNLDVAGWPCLRGSAVTPRAPATVDAPVTARLREAGAVILGKTTLPEYGWKGCGDSPVTGVTRNPWNVATQPGGSSSGGAVAAALNLGCIHIGTDGAGSIRIPAAFCGVAGIKPTFGRVAAGPISVMGFLAHLGPLARTVADLALALDVIGQPDGRDMTAPLGPPAPATGNGVEGLRIGWSPTLGRAVRVDPEVAALTEAAAQAFAELGAHVERADPAFDDPLDTLTTLWSAGAALALKPYDAAQRARMDPGLVTVAEAGARMPGPAYVDALLNGRQRVATAMADFHQTYDLLLTPTLPLPAFEAGRNTPADGSYGEQWETWTPFTYPFNLTQAPALSVPCGLTKAGLPVGLQIVGRFGADALVLRAGAAYEAARPFTRVDAPRS